MGTQNEVYTVGLLQAFGFFGGADAAGEGDLLDAALAPKAVQFAEVTPDAVDGVLADVAGVEDHEVGVLVALDLGVAGVLDHAPHPVRVVHVHLAAEGPYAGSLALGAQPVAADAGFRESGIGVGVSVVLLILFLRLVDAGPDGDLPRTALEPQVLYL